MYHVMLGADMFSLEFLFNTLNISSKHDLLAMFDRVVGAMYVWRRKVSGSSNKLPWNKTKELVANGDDKEVILANKVVDLLYIDYILSWRHNQWMSKGRGRVWAITRQMLLIVVHTESH